MKFKILWRWSTILAKEVGADLGVRPGSERSQRRQLCQAGQSQQEVLSTFHYKIEISRTIGVRFVGVNIHSIVKKELGKTCVCTLSAHATLRQCYLSDGEPFLIKVWHQNISWSI